MLASASASDKAMAAWVPCTDRFFKSCQGKTLDYCDLNRMIPYYTRVYVCCAARCTPRVLLIVEWCVQLHATVACWRGVVCAVPLCILRLA
jgi:hypothetical protein